MNTMVKGILLVVTYNVLSASKGVYLGHLLQGVQPFLLLFCSFSLVALFFGGSEWLFPSKGSPKFREGGWDLVMVNLMTAAAWITFYLAMKYLEPAVASAVANSLGPIVTLCLALLLGMGARPRSVEFLTSVGVMASVGLLIAATWLGKSGVVGASHESLLIGIAMAIACGITMAINTFFSKRLNVKGWSARKILAHRFYLILVVAAMLFPRNGMEWLSAPSHLGTVFVIAFLGVIVPLYTFQLGVQLLDPVVVALILSTVPLFAMGVQGLDRRLEFSAFSLTGICLVIAFSCLGVWVKAKPVRAR